MSRRLALLLAALAACARPERSGRDELASTAPAPTDAPSSPRDLAPPIASGKALVTDRVVLVAGGDISFGRLVGQMLLRDPALDFFAHLRPLLDSADLRFANLEGPLSEQKGETQKPGQPLVFTGPPGGADALARARFEIVSTANNHAWDYGKSALFETLAHLDRAGVRHAGTGADREASRRAEIVTVNGRRVAFFAVTDIWNQGALSRHPADEFVARAAEDLADRVRAMREAREAELILVSYHGGEEYVDTPLSRTRELLHAAIAAGADAVLGHHPHVVQGIEWYEGRPIFYSLGNLLMRMHRDHRWTEFGYLARTTFAPGEALRVEACPFRTYGVEVLPFAGDPQRAAYERMFFDHLASISVKLGGIAIDPPGADGCARVSQRSAAAASASRSAAVGTP
jgi:poly-gamma-glutamate synthesis protein (capsule biosynthesis protein)